MKFHHWPYSMHLEWFWLGLRLLYYCGQFYLRQIQGVRAVQKLDFHPSSPGLTPPTGKYHKKDQNHLVCLNNDRESQAVLIQRALWLINTSTIKLWPHGLTQKDQRLLKWRIWGKKFWCRVVSGLDNFPPTIPNFPIFLASCQKNIIRSGQKYLGHNGGSAPFLLRFRAGSGPISTFKCHFTSQQKKIFCT